MKIGDRVKVIKGIDEGKKGKIVNFTGHGIPVVAFDGETYKEEGVGTVTNASNLRVEQPGD
jgi:ribosomal protein L24